MQRSSFSLVIVAAALCAAAASTAYVVDRGRAAWRRTVDAIADLGRWLISRIPQAKPDWLGAWRRALAVRKDRVVTLWGAVRRPVVSPRWRMCPST